MKPRHLPLLALGFALALPAFSADSPKPAATTETVSDPVLQAELLAIRKADQSVRLEYDAIGRKQGWNAPELEPLRDAMMQSDATNLPKITTILDRRGWVGPEDVGSEAADTLFLVIQHSDPLTQQKYLPLLRAAVKAKKASAGHLALMEDRVALAEGRRQIYGSQLMSDYRDSKMRVRPIEDPEHVDERRAMVGLPPMAEYLAHWSLTWNVESHKREIPWLELMQLDVVPTPGKHDPALQKQLLAIYQDDQQGRQRISELQNKYGPNSPEVAALWKDIGKKDAATLAQVTAILDARGWVGPDVVGSQANSALFLVVQHADLPVQRKYLPLMRAAVTERRARPADLALLEDRIAIREGRPQIYGSQLHQSSSDPRMFVSPLADPDHVDEHRAAVGLPPMAESLKLSNITWDVEAYKKELPELEKLQWGDAPRPAGK